MILSMGGEFVSCFTATQESAIEGVHFIVKFKSAKYSFEQMLENLVHNQEYNYTTKLTYAFYQYYTLTRIFMSEDLYHEGLLQVLDMYNELVTGEDEDWFIECLKVLLYEKCYDRLQEADGCRVSIERMLELQETSSDNRPEFIITYIFKALFDYQNGQDELVAAALEKGLEFCNEGKVNKVLYGHFKEVLERFSYQTRQENKDRILRLIKKIAVVYF